MAKKTPPPASIQALTAEATLMSRLQGLPEEELKDILETMWGNAKIEYATMPDGNTGVRVYSGTSTQHDPADLKGARLFSPSESAANAHAEKYGGKTRVTSEVIPMMSAVSGAKVQSGVGEKFGYGYEIELNKQGQVVTPTKRSTKEIGLLSGTTPTIAQKFATGPKKTPGMTIDPKTAIDFEDTRDISAKSKAMRSGLTDLEHGKTSRFFKPGLGLVGLGLGAALAPDKAWAAPFSEEGLNYWGGAATGLDLGKAASDTNRLSPFSIGATLAEDTISGLGQMIGSWLDTSQVGADIQPDYGMGGGGYVGLGPEYRAGPDLPQGYDLSGQTPSLAGTQTGMDVAMDAGGAVPAPVVDYSQMAQDWGDPTMMSAPAFEQPDLSQPVSTENLAYTGMPSVFTGPGTQVAQLGGSRPDRDTIRDTTRTGRTLPPELIKEVDITEVGDTRKYSLPGMDDLPIPDLWADDPAQTSYPHSAVVFPMPIGGQHPLSATNVAKRLWSDIKSFLPLDLLPAEVTSASDAEEAARQQQQASYPAMQDVDYGAALALPSGITQAQLDQSVATAPQFVSNVPTVPLPPAAPAGPSPAEVNARLAQEAAARQQQQSYLAALDDESARRMMNMSQVQIAREVARDIEAAAAAGPAAGYGGYAGDPVGREAAIEARGGGWGGGRE